MRRYAPLLTLLAVVVLGGALLALNLFGDPGNESGKASPAPGRTSVPSRVAVAPTAGSSAPPGPSTPAVPPATAVQAPPVVAQKAYTGWSAGREVSVAIAVEDGRAVGYLCDGKKVEAWLQGTLTGANLALASKDGTSTLIGTVDADRSSGVATIAGKRFPYDARTATPPAGLYEGRVSVRGVLNRIGWIVLPDGTQTGLLDDGSGTAAPPVLDPGHPEAVLVDGVPVTVRTIGGGDVVIAP